MLPSILDADSGVALDRPFTTAEAVSAGVSTSKLSRWCAAGLVRRLLPTVYVVAQLPDTLAQRAAALALVIPPDSFVTDRTAAWLHGAPTALAPGDHLTAPKLSVFRQAKHGRHRVELLRSGERTLLPDEVTEAHGIPCTTPLRTALDLGRLLPRVAALSGLDAMLHTGLVTRDELLLGVSRFDRMRGVVQLRVLVPIADGRAESPGESALRLRWLDAGLPRPELQIPVRRGDRQLRIDLGLPDLRWGVEYDGAEFHSAPAARAHDRERRRWLAEHGWLINAFRRTDVYGRGETVSGHLTGLLREARNSFAERQRMAA